MDIPTVVSRIIQQAIAQVLVSLYESQFSSSSYGFHPHRNAHETIRSWHLNRHSNLTLQHLAADINPIVRDWIINYEKKVILKNTIIEGLIQYLATMHPVYE